MVDLKKFGMQNVPGQESVGNMLQNTPPTSPTMTSSTTPPAGIGASAKPVTLGRVAPKTTSSPDMDNAIKGAIYGITQKGATPDQVLQKYPQLAGKLTPIIHLLTDIKNGSGVDEIQSAYPEFSDELKTEVYGKLAQPTASQTTTEETPPEMNFGNLPIPGQGYVKTIPAVVGAGVVAGLAGLTTGQPKIVSTTPKFGGGMQTVKQLNKTQELANKLTQVSDIADEEAVREGSQIIAKYAKPNTKTYKDLWKQMDDIKSGRYNQSLDFNGKHSSLKSAMQEIKVPKGFSRAKQLINAMIEDVEGKLGQESLLKELTALKGGLNKGTANLWELNSDLKMNLNKFFKGWTPTGQSKSGLTPEGARNVYDEIRGYVEDLAERSGLKGVKEVNRGYHSVLTTEPYIDKLASKVMKAQAAAIPVSTAEKIGGVVGDIANVTLKKTGVLPVIKRALGFGGGRTTATIEQIEKQLPKILKNLAKTLPKATVSSLESSFSVMPPLGELLPKDKDGKVKKTALIDFIQETIENPYKYLTEEQIKQMEAKREESIKQNIKPMAGQILPLPQ